jgi:hypothetical protein
MMGVRMPPDERQAIEGWAALQEDTPSLSEAIRRLIAMALQSQRTSADATKAALKQRSLDRWAARISDLAWRQRFENLMRAAACGSKDPQMFDGLPMRGPFGEDYVAAEVRALFGIKWKDGKIVGTLADKETPAMLAKPHRPAKPKE